MYVTIEEGLDVGPLLGAVNTMDLGWKASSCM